MKVEWTVDGNIRSLCCYQMDIREERESNWRPYGRELPQQGERRTYSTDLRGLSGNSRYFIRIRGLSQAKDTAATSDPVAVTTQCSAPLAPPRDLTAAAPDSRSITLQWTPPPRTEWGCQEIFFNLEGRQGNDKPRLFRVDADPRGFRVAHRIAAQPGQRWTFRIQTANRGGVSAFSPPVSLTTPAEGYSPSLALSLSSFSLFPVSVCKQRCYLCEKCQLRYPPR